MCTLPLFSVVDNALGGFATLHTPLSLNRSEQYLEFDAHDTEQKTSFDAHDTSYEDDLKDW